MNHEHDSDLYLEYLKSKYSTIRVIISPPRCASTALARIFWGHPDVRFYAHEPFETTYYRQAPLTDALNLIDEPIDLEKNYSGKKQAQATGLIIKEMPYQVGQNFPLLVSLSKFPVIFLVRDPRLNIDSRIQKKLEAGTSPIFPLIETGWTLLEQQMKYCEEKGIEFVIVKSDDFRNNPANFLPKLMEHAGLTFSSELLSWEPALDINLDNLAGSHSHLYLKVLASTGVLPADEPLRDADDFPEDGGIREHVKEAIEIYQRTLEMKQLLRMERL